MSEERPDLQARLADSVVAWLTTVSPSGEPQPAPVWFVTEGDHIVIYSIDDVPRLRNIRANPRVALHLNSDVDGDDLTIIHGEAEIVGRDVPPSHDAAYAAKYQRHLSRWDFTWATFDAGYPVRIHVTPTRVRR